MAGLIRDAPLGQIIRWVMRNRTLLYPEERPDFQCPECYSEGAPVLSDATTPELTEKGPDAMVGSPTSQHSNGLERAVTTEAVPGPTTRTELSKVTTQAELAEAYTKATMEKGPTQPVFAEKLNDGMILVTWYTTDDPENPQNWPNARKTLVTLQIW